MAEKKKNIFGLAAEKAFVSMKQVVKSNPKKKSFTWRK